MSRGRRDGKVEKRRKKMGKKMGMIGEESRDGPVGKGGNTQSQLFQPYFIYGDGARCVIESTLGNDGEKLGWTENGRQ